jgi:hypothetical protein
MRLFASLVFALLATLTLGACIEANVDDGVLLCALDPNRPCPRHYYCASNGYCYHDGHTPPPKRASDSSASSEPPAAPAASEPAATSAAPAAAEASDMSPASD